MSDHDATQPPASGSPRPGEGDEFNARTVLINQDMLDAARAESQQAAGQVPGAVPGAQAQAGSWRPVQPDLPAGPPPEEQTRAYPVGAGAAAAQPAAAPADPYRQPNPYAQQGGTDPFGPPSPQPQPGQPAQFGQPDPAAGAGVGGTGASPFQSGQHVAQPGTQPAPYNQPAQPVWGAPQADGAAAAASSPFAQSAPGIPSAPGTASDPGAGTAPGAAASQETLYWQDQQPPVQPAAPQDQQAFAQQPAPHSHPFSGGHHDGDVGMSSVFPTATARAEAEQAAEAFVPAAAQPVAQSAPSSAPSVQSQGSAPQWGSAPSSDAAAGQAPAFSDLVPPASGASFGQAAGGALAEARAEAAGSVDSVGSWLLTMLLMTIPGVNLVYLLVLAFGSGRSVSKRNWARATLIWAVIAAVLSVLLIVVLGVLGWTFNASSQSG
ncbi:hypothetical protein [Actinomyces sp. ZJ308]|uniref:hypothetical protein n=1 Tax=Actinomyces sp. ZJ308 TaxID=2708342 RepID=UPI001FBB42AE|nr:hypothetical protein [Actinomyces sp. ZJ308]